MIHFLKEYDPDLCSKYGDGTDVETYVINDAEDDYDYWQFAASTLGSGKYIWITEEPGFFLNHLNLNEDPSRYVTLYFKDFKIKHYKYTVYSACIFSLLIRIRLIKKRILNKKTKRRLLDKKFV